MADIRRNPTKYIKILGSVYVIMEWISGVTEMSVLLDFDMLSVGLNAVSYLILSVPFILFLVYIAIGYKKKKDHILLKISFTLLTLISLGNAFLSVRSAVFYANYTATTYINLVTRIITCVCYVFMLVDVFSGLKYAKRSGVCVVVSGSASCICLVFRTVVEIFIEGNMSIGFCGVGYIISALFLCACLSIFWFVAVPYTRTTTLELDLEELHAKYMQGAISAEQYQIQKTQILEKI